MNFCASRARARTADLGVQFLCFWVILGIASRSSFGIFAIGGASDELQFHACNDTCTRARIDVLDGIFQYFIGIQFFGGSAERIINSRLNQPFQNNLIKTDFPCMTFGISMLLIAAVWYDYHFQGLFDRHLHASCIDEKLAKQTGIGFSP